MKIHNLNITFEFTEVHLPFRTVFLHWRTSQLNLFLFVILHHLLNLRRFSLPNTNSSHASEHCPGNILSSQSEVWVFSYCFQSSQVPSPAFLLQKTPLSSITPLPQNQNCQDKKSRCKCRSNSQMRCSGYVLVIMKQNRMEQMKAGEGRILPKALKAPSESHPSEDTNIRGYLSRCYHLDRQISCLHQQSPVQPKHSKSIPRAQIRVHTNTHTPKIKDRSSGIQLWWQ